MIWFKKKRIIVLEKDFIFKTAHYNVITKYKLINNTLVMIQVNRLRPNSKGLLVPNKEWALATYTAKSNGVYYVNIYDRKGGSYDK